MQSRLALDQPPRWVLTACLTCKWVHEFPGTCPKSSETWRNMWGELGGEGITRHGFPALDGVGDKRDKEGYDVTVVWKDGEESKSLTKKALGNPACRYCAPNGTLLDVDSDGIADLDEVDPWNSTTPAVQAFVEFFRTNQTMMNNTFQPMVRDEMPPTLYRVEPRSEAEFACALVCVPYHAWTVVDVEVVDPSAFTVAVTVLDVWRTVTLTGAGRLVATVTMDIDVLGDYLIDYQVVVTATDAAGNTVSVQQDVDGILGALAEFLTSIAAAIWDAVVAVAAAVAAVLSFLLEIAATVIRAVLDPLLSPIVDAGNQWIQAIHSWINAAMFEFDRTGTLSASTLSRFKQAWNGPFLTFVTALVLALVAVAAAAMILTGGLALAASFLIDLVIGLIFTALVGAIGSLGEQAALITAAVTGDLGAMILAVQSFLAPFANRIESHSWIGTLGSGIALIAGILGAIFAGGGLITIIGVRLSRNVSPPGGWLDWIMDPIGLALAAVGIWGAFQSDFWVNVFGFFLSLLGVALTLRFHHPVPIIERWAHRIALASLLGSMFQVAATGFGLP